MGEAQIINHTSTGKNSTKSSRSSKPDISGTNSNLIHQNISSNGSNSTDTNLHNSTKNSGNKTKTQNNSELKNDDSSNISDSGNTNNSETNSSKSFIRDPPPINAAIYPVLPGKREVQLLLKKVDFELKETRQRLSELNKLKQQNLLVKANFEALDSSLKVQSHYGMIISTNSEHLQCTTNIVLQIVK